MYVYSVGIPAGWGQANEITFSRGGYFVDLMVRVYIRLAWLTAYLRSSVSPGNNY